MSILIKPRFLKIPSYVIRRFNDMDKKDVLVNQNTLIPELLIRLQMQMNLDDECAFSIDNLISKCGYAAKTGKGKSIDLFRQALQIIKDNGFIYDISFGEGVNFSNVRTSTMLTCKYNENLSVTENKELTNYCIIDIEDYIKMTRSATGSNLRNLINVYCYLVSRKLLSINNGEENQKQKKSIKPNSLDIDTMRKHNSKDLVYVDRKDFHKFGYTFVTYDDMCADVSEDGGKTLSKTTLANVLNQLADLKIIYYGNIHDYLGITTIKKPCNIYAFTEHGYTTGLKTSFSKYQSLNPKKYTEKLREKLLKNLKASLKRNEYHVTPKECEDNVN